MNDLIKLKLVTEDEAECLHRLQVEAFMPLYEKYQDDDTSPVQIPLHRITDSASNGSVFPVVTEHFSASSDHAFL